MKKKAQAISEYVVLLTVIAAALTAMQIYFRRSISAVVKVAADEVGAQKEGAATYDYNLEWKEKQDAQITSTSFGVNTEVKLPEAAVIHGKDETTRQEGILSFGVAQEKE
jgi:hypothetical protein